MNTSEVALPLNAITHVSLDRAIVYVQLNSRIVGTSVQFVLQDVDVFDVQVLLHPIGGVGSVLFISKQIHNVLVTDVPV